tara:strand:+ start:1330 stop:2262 length:933 start_codon:yes stop_codon:yes gene_type:complete
MINIEPINQIKLLGLNRYILELINLFKEDKLPNKILLSGSKGLGKSTLAYHFINYSLSKNEEFSYDEKNFKIDINNQTFKTIQNNSNPNFTLIDIQPDKKLIDINQIRNLILNLNKSSFNKKPRFVLIDNIEFLNINSINALLKILEEPTDNVHFILINSNKKILSTLSSRCINFKIFLSHNECLEVSKKLLNNELYNLINDDLRNYYLTPGNIYRLVKFAQNYKYDLVNINLKEFLKLIIKENHYKKNIHIKYLFFDLVEYYFRKINLSITTNIHDKYSYFLKKISDTRKFNLDEESLFMEFEEEILNG